jgi:hypothetical protein
LQNVCKGQPLAAYANISKDSLNNSVIPAVSTHPGFRFAVGEVGI